MSEIATAPVSNEVFEQYTKEINSFVERMSDEYPDFVTIAAGAAVQLQPPENPDSEEEIYEVLVAAQATEGPSEGGIALGAAAAKVILDASAVMDEGYEAVCNALSLGIAQVCEDDEEAVTVGVALQLAADDLGIPPLVPDEAEEDGETEDAG